MPYSTTTTLQASATWTSQGATARTNSSACVTSSTYLALLPGTLAAPWLGYDERRLGYAAGALGRVPHATEAQVAGRAVGRVGATRRDAVAVAVRGVAQVRAAAHHPMGARRRAF